MNFYKKLHISYFKLPNIITFLLSIITISLVIFIIFSLVNSNIKSVIETSDGYNEKLQNILSEKLLLPFVNKDVSLKELFISIDFEQYLKELASFFSKIPAYASMIFIFTIFLLMEHKTFHKKLSLMIKEKTNLKKAESLIKKIMEDINLYLKIKTLSSLTTAIVSFLILFFFDIKFASFWALIIFLLNYIPTIGSIFAVFLISIFILFQTESLYLFLVISSILTAIQVIIGGIIEPKFLGKFLNLSPLAIISFLFLWDSIWGVIGMFLCVPIMVIVNIILSNFESTRGLAVFFSSTGKINTNINDKFKKIKEKLRIRK